MVEKIPVEKLSPVAAQEQLQGLIFGDKISWQSLIYELINTEQLDPWDIDIVILSNRFLEKVRELEEANFFLSSKVLLAASLLLRIKSEILLNNYLPTLDEILFGKKEEKRYQQERIELDEEIPDLVPRTPLPRSRKVTLQELMSALGKAIKTENRRIKRVVLTKQQEIETSLSLPKKTINLKDKITEVYTNLKKIFSTKQDPYPFSLLIQDKSNEKKIETFMPLLHLDNQHKLLLQQDAHLEEIWIWLKEIHSKVHKEELSQLEKEVQEALNAESTGPFEE